MAKNNNNKNNGKQSKKSSDAYNGMGNCSSSVEKNETDIGKNNQKTKRNDATQSDRC